MARLDYLPDWPNLRPDLPANPALEQFVRGILAQMTVEEKLGQMIQPDLLELTAEDVRAYRLGSALNGAGRWPGEDRRAGAIEWTTALDGFWQAAEEAYRDRSFRIPFMWATDAVHGHNNVHGATIFPHNIGLGAAGEPGLVRRIGVVTAREVAATGMDWTFAPTVATPRDRRWGRHYEGYSEDPEIVHAYAGEMVRGLQGNADELRTDTRVLSCVKHWVGDGGTFEGTDRGNARCDEDLLRNIHAMGFISGIQAGSQSVMVSYSAWGDEGRLHGSHYLLTDVLKERMGFDGVVISDWDAHAYVDGCSDGDAGNAIRAGVDVLMISTKVKWQAVHRTALTEIRSGAIPMSRVDDAVLRVLRVKARAGLWEKPRPLERSLAGHSTALGHPEHRALAREAVRKSLVLLKNDNRALPLPRTSRVLVAGSAAAAIAKQTGGFTVTWQGDDIGLEDFPAGNTFAMAIGEAVGADRCTVDPYLEHEDPTAFDVVLVAIGEDAYAEMFGSIKPWRTMAYAGLKPGYAKDLETLRRLRQTGAVVVTVMFSGRPLYVTEEINLSDAFVAAWLPGPEVSGIADVLFTEAEGDPGHDFQGRLSFGWPGTRTSFTANRIPRHIPDYRVPEGEVLPIGQNTPLFPYGYGLTLAETHGDSFKNLGELPLDVEPELPEALLDDITPIRLALHGDGAYEFLTRAEDYGPRPIRMDGPTACPFIEAEPIDHLGRGDGLSLAFKGIQAFVYVQFRDGGFRDLRGYVANEGRLTFQVRVFEPPTGPFNLTCHDDYPQQPALDISTRLSTLPYGEWAELVIPLSELVGVGIEFDHVDVPFQLWTEGRARLDISAVQLSADVRAM